MLPSDNELLTQAATAVADLLDELGTERSAREKVAGELVTARARVTELEQTHKQAADNTPVIEWAVELLVNTGDLLPDHKQASILAIKQEPNKLKAVLTKIAHLVPGPPVIPAGQSRTREPNLPGEPRPGHLNWTGR